jgi:hypothetical protein
MKLLRCLGVAALLLSFARRDGKEWTFRDRRDVSEKQDKEKREMKIDSREKWCALVDDFRTACTETHGDQTL